MNSLERYLDNFQEDALYLNHASYGPPSVSVRETVQELFATAARGGPHAAAGLHEVDERARRAISSLAGFPAQNVALTTSTSQGLMQLAFGLSGEVLVSTDEFPANVYPWFKAQEFGRLGVRSLPGSGDGTLAPVTPARIADALTPSITAVSISAVDFRTGFRADLDGIRAAIGSGRLLVVDAIQGFGVLDIDWSPADAVVVGGQKWLRAGWGAGFVAFSDRGLSSFAPSLAGWTAVEDPGRYDGLLHAVRADAGRYSITSASPFAVGALASALELVEATGVSVIETAVRRSVDALIAAIDRKGLELLSPRELSHRAGIVVAGYPPGRAPEAHARLSAAGVTATLHGDTRVRFSPHASTSLEAIQRIEELLT
jgi:selenocysteine lyase/cysteine desulfurase